MIEGPAAAALLEEARNAAMIVVGSRWSRRIRQSAARWFGESAGGPSCPLPGCCGALKGEHPSTVGSQGMRDLDVPAEKRPTNWPCCSFGEVKCRRLPHETDWPVNRRVIQSRRRFVKRRGSYPGWECPRTSSCFPAILTISPAGCLQDRDCGLDDQRRFTCETTAKAIREESNPCKPGARVDRAGGFRGRRATSAASLKARVTTTSAATATAHPPTKRLENLLKREQLPLANQKDRLALSNEVTAEASRWVAELKSEGKDTTSLETALNAYEAAASSASRLPLLRLPQAHLPPLRALIQPARW